MHAVPDADAKVRISYTAKLVDGTVFDSRSPEDPLEFTTEEGEKNRLILRVSDATVLSSIPHLCGPPRLHD